MQVPMKKCEHGKITWRELRGHYSVITDEAQYEIAYIYIPFLQRRTG